MPSTNRGHLTLVALIGCQEVTAAKRSILVHGIQKKSWSSGALCIYNIIPSLSLAIPAGAGGRASNRMPRLASHRAPSLEGSQWHCLILVTSSRGSRRRGRFPPDHQTRWTSHSLWSRRRLRILLYLTTFMLLVHFFSSNYIVRFFAACFGFCFHFAFYFAFSPPLTHGTGRWVDTPLQNPRQKIRQWRFSWNYTNEVSRLNHLALLIWDTVNILVNAGAVERPPSRQYALRMCNSY